MSSPKKPNTTMANLRRCRLIARAAFSGRSYGAVKQTPKPQPGKGVKQPYRNHILCLIAFIALVC